MTTFTQSVLSIGWESKGSKKWRSIEVQDVKGGKTFKQHLFPDKSGDVIALIEKEGPGIYEIDKEKEGDFWIVQGARKVGNLNGKASSNGSGPATPQAAQSPHMLRAMIAGQCANAAATLVAALVAAGEFKGAGEDAILTYAKTIAKVLRDDAREFVNGKPKPEPAPKPEPKPEPAPEPAPEPEGV